MKDPSQNIDCGGTRWHFVTILHKQPRVALWAYPRRTPSETAPLPTTLPLPPLSSPSASITDRHLGLMEKARSHFPLFGLGLRRRELHRNPWVAFKEPCGLPLRPEVEPKESRRQLWPRIAGEGSYYLLLPRIQQGETSLSIGFLAT